MTTILVVDDNEIDRRRVGQLLSQGCDALLQYAGDGAEALATLDGRRGPLPDLIVTDLCMPKIDGLGLVQEVRRRYPMIPLVLMTMNGTEEVAMQALRAGAASYLPKHALERGLVETVQQVLAAAQQDRAQLRMLSHLHALSYFFSLENDSALIPPLVHVLLDQIAAPILPDEGERVRVGVALEEALVNALFHGNLELDSRLREGDGSAFYELAQRRLALDPYRERRIHVSAQRRDNTVTFVVRDEGPGFDVSTLPDPTAPENLERAYGRGLLLIRTFMDEVTHNDLGNEIKMIKRGGTQPEFAPAH